MNKNVCYLCTLITIKLLNINLNITIKFDSQKIDIHYIYIYIYIHAFILWLIINRIDKILIE